MSKFYSFLLLFISCTISTFSIAQTSVSALDNAVTENFDGLPSTGSVTKWVQDNTVPGWYAYETSPHIIAVDLLPDSGTQNSGRMYSYGRAGSSDRCLGSLASGSTNKLGYGWRLKNNTGKTVTSVTVNFTGEQWRAAANTNPNSIYCFYKIASSIPGIDSAEIIDFASNGYTAVPNLDFVSPIFGGSTMALNGNDPANSTKISHTIDVNLPNGSEIMIAWSDENDAGSDHGLGIDDISVTFSAKVVNNPLYKIATVASVDANGVPDSNGVDVRVQGVVYGVNYRPSGLQFTIRDNTGGIGIFSSSTKYGYTVTEGDEVIVSGKVSHFRGLTQISPVDTVILLSSGNALNKPAKIKKMNEFAESNLVKIEKLTWAETKPATWTSNTNFKLTNGVDTFDIRVDGDIDLAGMTIPTYDTMSVTGIGGQFASSSTGPYFDGYQLLPRYMQDIQKYSDILNPIGVISKVDATTGVPDSLNVWVRVKGVVYGGNYRTTGLSFTLRDYSGGINIFEFDKNFGYTVTEGDEVYVEGIVTHFRGLTEISTIDTLIKMSSGNSLKSPVEVSTVTEMYESDLVKIKMLWWAEAKPTEWKANTNYLLTNGTDTTLVRIDGEIDLAGTATPAYDTMNITGLGGQYANSSSGPFTDGYQLFPRYIQDVEQWVRPSTGNIEHLSNFAKVYPNPSNGNLSIRSKTAISRVEILNTSGQMVYELNPQKQSQLNLETNLSSGLYFLKVYSGDQKQISKIQIQ